MSGFAISRRAKLLNFIRGGFAVTTGGETTDEEVARFSVTEDSLLFQMVPERSRALPVFGKRFRRSTQGETTEEVARFSVTEDLPPYQVGIQKKLDAHSL